MTNTKGNPTGLALLREPFPPNQISKLPKPTKRQSDDVKADFSKGVRCKECGGWHHPSVVHLDYVGHAALTDRLLDCDPEWNWEPAGFSETGQPIMDPIGGMWIKLTVCGVTRLGYGNPDGKTGGNAIKEVIGDALRNAAMRFGAALDLWHKGDLHADDTDSAPLVDDDKAGQNHEQKKATKEEIDAACEAIESKMTLEFLGEYWKGLNENALHVAKNNDVISAKDERKAELTRAMTNQGAG